MMKRTITSLKALILAALLALPLSAYCDATYTFYVKYTGSTDQISTPYLHLWDSSNSSSNTTTWPGLQMTYSYIDSDGYYVYTLTTTLAFTPDNFIFDTGNNGSQTSDCSYTFSSDGGTYYITVGSMTNNNDSYSVSTDGFVDVSVEDNLYNVYFIVPSQSESYTSPFGSANSSNKFAYERERNGNSYLEDYQTYNIQTFVLKKIAAAAGVSTNGEQVIVPFQLYKTNADNTAPDAPWHYVNADTMTVASSYTTSSSVFGGEYTDQQNFGNAKISANISGGSWSSSATTYYIELEEDDSAVVSYTIIYGGNNGGASEVLVVKNYRNFGGTRDSQLKWGDRGDELVSDSSYYLTGNWNYADADHDINPLNDGSRSLMQQRWWKGGKSYTSEVADYDSLTYITSVSRPAEGWGEMYMAIFDKAIIKQYNSGNDLTDSEYSNSFSDNDKTKLWNYAIRPQGSPYYGSDIAGLDQTAIHGGLYTRRSESGDHQQALNPTVSDDVTEFLFSMNITTSSYRISFVSEDEDHGFYIMGPAVGTWTDGTTDYSSAWANSDDNSHALRLTYDSDEQCYKYMTTTSSTDDDGNTTETETEAKIHLNAGQPFCFVYDRDFSQALYMEDDVTPVDMSGTDTSNEESNVYGLASNDTVNDNHDTQYINFLEHIDGTDSTAYNADVNAITFNLPSGDYNIRLYSKTLNGVSKYYYIISPRELKFNQWLAYDTGVLIDDSNNECTAFKTYSDYYAIVLPDSICAWTVNTFTLDSDDETNAKKAYVKKASEESSDDTGSASDNQIGTVTLNKITWESGADRIIPANTPVILGFKSSLDVPSSASDFNRLSVTDIEYCTTPWTTADSVSFASDVEQYVSGNAFIQQTERKTMTQPTDGNSPYYYMFGSYIYSYETTSTDSDGNTTTETEKDGKRTLGFYLVTSNTTTAINSAYCQVSLGSSEEVSSSKGFTIAALDDDTDALDDSDESETTGIDAIAATDDNSGDGYYYNLQGMRLTQKPTTKGIYIHNGKKIIVR